MITKKRVILPLLFVMVILLIMECTPNSALSDVEITDPSLLKVTIEMRKSQDQNGSLSHTIEAFLYDKNDEYVSLKKGALYVNGVKMELQTIPVINQPCYTAPAQVNFMIDSLYTFTVMLADSSKHFFTVRTQKQDIYSFTVPTNVSKHIALNMSWLNKDTTGTLFIESTNGYSQISDPASGTFSFPPNFFSDTTYGSDVYVYLHSVKYGTIGQAFRNGSYIYSEIVIYRTVHFTD